MDGFDVEESYADLETRDYLGCLGSVGSAFPNSGPAGHARTSEDARRPAPDDGPTCDDFHDSAARARENRSNTGSRANDDPTAGSDGVRFCPAAKRSGPSGTGTRSHAAKTRRFASSSHRRASGPHFARGSRARGQRPGSTGRAATRRPASGSGGSAGASELYASRVPGIPVACHETGTPGGFTCEVPGRRHHGAGVSHEAGGHSGRTVSGKIFSRAAGAIHRRFFISCPSVSARTFPPWAG